MICIRSRNESWPNLHVPPVKHTAVSHTHLGHRLHPLRSQLVGVGLKPAALGSSLPQAPLKPLHHLAMTVLGQAKGVLCGRQLQAQNDKTGLQSQSSRPRIYPHRTSDPPRPKHCNSTSAARTHLGQQLLHLEPRVSLGECQTAVELRGSTVGLAERTLGCHQPGLDTLQL